MSPYGRKPHANVFVMLHRREALDPVVAPVHGRRERRAAIEEGLRERDDDDLLCCAGSLPCPCDPCAACDYCEACDGPCCGLADEHGRCACAEELRQARALATESAAAVASHVLYARSA